MVEGTLTVVLPLVQGLVVAAQIMFVLLELRPRASITVPVDDGYDEALKRL